MMSANAPLLVKLPREVGRRDNRYAHLFSGEVGVSSVLPSADLTIRIAELEAEVVTLRNERDQLKQQLEMKNS